MVSQGNHNIKDKHILPSPLTLSIWVRDLWDCGKTQQNKAKDTDLSIFG